MKSVISLFILVLIASPIEALQTREDYRSLKGISGVCVTVSDVSDDVATKGIGRDSINSYVELRLRNSGIRVALLHK